MNLPSDFFSAKFRMKLPRFPGTIKQWLLPFWSFFILLGFLFLGAAIIKEPSLPAKLRPILGFKELLPTPAPYPVNQKISEFPNLSANSLIVLDVDSMATLYERNSSRKVFPASTTKVMTALIVLKNYPLDQLITVGQTKVEGNQVKLVPGERMTAENLLYCLLVGSGNDAAVVLAENYPQGTTAFVEAMNRQAQELKLENTHFTNPVGLDEEGHYSTAGDLARLAVEALKNPVFSRIVSTPSIVVTDESGQMTHFLKNTNELMGKLEGVKGVKTGWTENAGECLITLDERNGHKIVTVILGSKDRFGETQTLIEWVFQNFSWQMVRPGK